MHSYQHPARKWPYDVIIGNMDRLVKQGLVSEKIDGWHSLFCYTQKCTFERAWDPFTEMARGLIVDRDQKKVVATPFTKFFNLFERPGDAHSHVGTEFDALEKHDGSLIIIWHDGKGIRTCTKGAFWSDQAVAAHKWIMSDPRSVLYLDTAYMKSGYTYLAEWVSPDNKIVIPYDKSELILLAAFTPTGEEFTYDAVRNLGATLGWKVAARKHFDRLEQLVDHVATLPSTEEGFVVRYPNGHRIKVKGAEYLRVHRLISNCTPLAIWESLQAGDDVGAIRLELPEEFWVDFDSIVSLIQRRVHTIVYETMQLVYSMATMTDKEVGLDLHRIKEPYRGLIFPFRKNGGYYTNTDSRLRKAVYKLVRPTANKLEGYAPSGAMHRAQEELLS